MSLGHPDGSVLVARTLFGFRGVVTAWTSSNCFYGAVFLRGTTSGAVLVLLVVVSGSLEDPGEVRADRRFVLVTVLVARYERYLDGEGAQRRQQLVA